MTIFYTTKSLVLLFILYIFLSSWWFLPCRTAPLQLKYPLPIPLTVQMLIWLKKMVEKGYELIIAHIKGCPWRIGVVCNFTKNIVIIAACYHRSIAAHLLETGCIAEHWPFLLDAAQTHYSTGGEISNCTGNRYTHGHLNTVEPSSSYRFGPECVFYCLVLVSLLIALVQS